MNDRPLISIVLPLFNAISHLETGLNSIINQTYTNWELIAVNDGSTDQTKEVFLEKTRNWQQTVKLIDRVNGGGFEARNTGLDNVQGAYIAFFDVDDRWYPHHLASLLSSMEKFPEIDWLYAANKIIDLTQNDRVIEESSFYVQGQPKEFLSLKTKPLGNLKLIEDKRAVEFQLRYGIWLGQQFSLAKAKVFQDYRFRSSYRNEGADQIAVIRAFKEGFQIAYLNQINGEYAVHFNNASAGCKNAPIAKYIRLRHALIRGFRELESELDLNVWELKALNKYVADNYFWQLGYNINWQNGNRNEAFKYFRKGIYYSPFNWKFWKTYIACCLKQVISKD